jgi:hypothetical protein
MWIGAVNAGTLYVGTTGKDSNDGSFSKPLKTISYAISKAKAGDTLSINDGVYTIGQLKIPAGVSLTSTSRDHSRVKLQPNADLGSKPFIDLSSSLPGSSGDQSISHIELNGINGGYRAITAINVKNRNNVKILHCYMHDFYGSNEETQYTIKVESSYIDRTTRWWEYLPADVQAPGIDDNLDKHWPKKPVMNFEFAYNTIKDCFAISPFNLKNSTFHHNDVDNSSVGGWCMKATASFLWNVDIYDNTFKGGAPDAYKQTPWRVELWMLRNGCELYNNEMDGFFSITYGKETKIYDNIIDKKPASNGYMAGIEFTAQSYGEVYGNYISGAGNGIRIGLYRLNSRDYINEHILIQDNTIVDYDIHGIRIEADGSDLRYYNQTVRNVIISNNRLQGRSGSKTGIQLHQSNSKGDCSLTNVTIENNVVTSVDGYAGSTTGAVSNAVIDSNIFSGNKYNTWNGTKITNTINSISNVDFSKPVPKESMKPPVLFIMRKS